MSELEEEYDGILRRAQKAVEIEFAEVYHLGRRNGHDERGIILASARNSAFKEAAQTVKEFAGMFLADNSTRRFLETIAELIEAKIK